MPLQINVQALWNLPVLLRTITRAVHTSLTGVKNQAQEAVFGVIAYVLTLITGVKNQIQEAVFKTHEFLVSLLKKAILQILVTITLLLALNIVSFVWKFYFGILKWSKHLAQRLILYAVQCIRDIVKSIFQRLVLNVLERMIQYILRRFPFLQTVWNTNPILVWLKQWVCKTWRLIYHWHTQAKKKTTSYSGICVPFRYITSVFEQALLYTFNNIYTVSFFELVGHVWNKWPSLGPALNSLLTYARTIYNKLLTSVKAACNRLLRLVKDVWKFFFGILKWSKDLAQRLILYGIQHVTMQDIVIFFFQQGALNYAFERVTQYILERLQFLQRVWNNIPNLVRNFVKYVFKRVVIWDVLNRLGRITIKQFFIALYSAFYCIVELFNFVDKLLPVRIKGWLDYFKTLLVSAYVKVEHICAVTITLLRAIIEGLKEIAVGFGTACGALVFCWVFSLSWLLHHRKEEDTFQNGENLPKGLENFQTEEEIRKQEESRKREEEREEEERKTQREERRQEEEWRMEEEKGKEEEKKIQEQKLRDEEERRLEEERRQMEERRQREERTLKEEIERLEEGNKWEKKKRERDECKQKEVDGRRMEFERQQREERRQREGGRREYNVEYREEFVQSRQSLTSDDWRHGTTSHGSQRYERRQYSQDYDGTPRDRSPRKYDRTSREYDRTPREYDRTPREYDRAPREYDSTPREYDRTPREYDRTPREYDRTPREEGYLIKEEEEEERSLEEEEEEHSMEEEDIRSMEEEDEEHSSEAEEVKGV